MVLRAIGVIATAGLVLSACTGSPPDPEVSASPSNDPTPAVSASPSPQVPAKPERPEAMKRKDAEGAAAAAEYFVSLYAYTRATGDTKEWDAMSHQACAFCRDSSAKAKVMADTGEILVGGELHAEVVQVYERDGLTGIYPLDARVTQDAYETTDSEGEVIDSSGGEVVDRRIEVGRSASGWVVVTIAPIPGQEK